eukprot:scaffold168712_cov31-Tisochrysis_lutea.AAC.2
MLMSELSMKMSIRKKRSPTRCRTPESSALFLPVCQKAKPHKIEMISVDTKFTQMSRGWRSATVQWRAESASSCTKKPGERSPCGMRAQLSPREMLSFDSEDMALSSPTTVSSVI